MDNLRLVAGLPGRGCEERTGEKWGEGRQEVTRIFNLFKCNRVINGECTRACSLTEFNRFFSEERAREENCPLEFANGPEHLQGGLCRYFRHRSGLVKLKFFIPRITPKWVFKFRPSSAVGRRGRRESEP